MKRILYFFLTVLIIVPLVASSKDTPILAQKPTLSRTHVVFVYAGDL